MLVIVINKGSKKSIGFATDIAPWLKYSSGWYKIKEYNDGKLVKTMSGRSPKWNHNTPEMKNLDICLYEVMPE